MRIASGIRCQVHGLYSPRAISSLVAPTVRKVAVSSTNRQPSDVRGSVMSVSSKSARPVEPPGLIGAHGTTCFCPESATAATQSPVCGRRRNARIAGFSPLLALRYSIAPSLRHSIRWE